MKTRNVILAAGVVLASMGLCSCNPQDTSALEEIERLKAELSAAQLETEQARKQLVTGQSLIEEMRTKLESTAGSLEQAVAAKVPTPEELHGKMSKEMFKLRSEVEKSNPACTISEVTLGNIQGPSLEYPFSCQVKMSLKAPSGKSGLVYFKGRGNPAGDWTFDQIDPSKAVETAVAAAAPKPATPATPALPPAIASISPKPATPATPPKPREKTVSERLQEQANKRGAMKADQTRIIDLSKMQPLNIR